MISKGYSLPPNGKLDIMALSLRYSVSCFAAEDAPQVVRRRPKVSPLGPNWTASNIHVIIAPMLWLDRPRAPAGPTNDRPKICCSIRWCACTPSTSKVVPPLAYLRNFRRYHHTAVALVHHARKGAGHERGGQALHGSSES